jgi:hypothetical protein
MFLREADDSVVDRKGRVVFFSLDRFIAEIAQGGFCFVCGASPGDKEFNDEHVIPDWVLKKHRLHSGRLVLPNTAELMYGRYVLPCCVDCNAEMSAVFEAPISEAFAGGYKTVCDFVEARAPLVFTWLALMFLKTHLKHRELRWHLDARRGQEKIADLYNWNQLHHIHCIIRSFYSGATVAPRVYGSLAVLPATLIESPEHFDYGDLRPGRSVLFRFGDAAVIAILDDCGAVMGAMEHVFKALGGPLTILQLRELMVRMAYCNMLLQPRPRFLSAFDLEAERYVIDAEIPDEFSLIEDPDPGLFGRLFDFAVGQIIAGLPPDQANPQTAAHVKEGRFTFLFDDNGKFLTGEGDP